MTLIYLFLLNLIFLQNIPVQKPTFNSPVDFPIYLSGNFGELRLDHFHSGIDIKTGGVTLKKVYSVEEGYISRIKVQTNGYGYSLYINHPGGYTSVYGHLDSYNKEIDKYCKKFQYNKMSYTVDIYPKKSDLPVSKGEFIAFSGNSGGSNGPHLHFELRNSGNQEPLNPLKFGFEVKDKIPPLISGLFVYSLDQGKQITPTPVEYKLKQQNGVYGLSSSQPVKIEGKGGFGVEVHDYLDDSSNPCGIYTIELSIDNSVIYLFRVDEFSFEESRYVNAHADYRMEVLNDRQVHLLFRKPNNRLSMYPVMINDGIFNFQPGTKYPVNIRITDASGNESKLDFEVEGGSLNMLSDSSDTNTNPIFSWQSNNYFEDSFVRLEVPKGAIYENMSFEYARTFSRAGLYPYTHYIGSPSIPLHSSSILSFNAGMIPDSLRKKSVIIRLIKNKEPSCEGGNWTGDWLNTRILTFGKYTIEIDSIPPHIKALNIKPDTNLTAQQNIRFEVTDKLSGISEYEGHIDNNWVLFEYDPKNDLMFYKFDKTRLKSGTKHELELYVKDAVGNKSGYHSTFIW